MTKQKEIDKILTKYTGRTGIHLDVVKRELSEAGVVVKEDYTIQYSSSMPAGTAFWEIKALIEEIP